MKVQRDGVSSWTVKNELVRRDYVKRIITVFAVLLLFLAVTAFTFGQVNEFELDVGTVSLIQMNEGNLDAVVLHVNSPWYHLNIEPLTYEVVSPAVQSNKIVDAHVLNFITCADISRLYSKNITQYITGPNRPQVLQLKYPILGHPMGAVS